MSKKVVLLGDMGTDHSGFPPTPVIAGSPDVLIDGKPVARVGDPLAPHSKPKHPPHPRAIAARWLVARLCMVCLLYTSDAADE